jgi:glutamyl-tRNA synthetase
VFACFKECLSALRDPALARCVDTPHQITGTQFKCYPTYDLAIAVCDDLEGVTHAMRDSQYQERIPLYKVHLFLFSFIV